MATRIPYGTGGVKSPYGMTTPGYVPDLPDGMGQSVDTPYGGDGGGVAAPPPSDWTQYFDTPPGGTATIPPTAAPLSPKDLTSVAGDQPPGPIDNYQAPGFVPDLVTTPPPVDSPPWSPVPQAPTETPGWNPLAPPAAGGGAPDPFATFDTGGIKAPLPGVQSQSSDLSGIVPGPVVAPGTTQQIPGVLTSPVPPSTTPAAPTPAAPAPTTPTAATTAQQAHDPDYIRQQVTALLLANGMQPTDGPGPGNVDYWVQQISKQPNGWEAYWQSRIPQEVRAWNAGQSPGSPGYVGPTGGQTGGVPTLTGDPTVKSQQGGGSTGLEYIGPALSGTPEEALQYLNQQATAHGHSLSELTPAQTATIYSNAGYVPGQPVTGTMVNSVIDQINKIWGLDKLPSGPDVEQPGSAGDSPFSKLLDDAIAKMIANGGATDSSTALTKILNQLINGGGYNPDPNNTIDANIKQTLDSGGNYNQAIVDARTESAREAEAKAMRTNLNDARGELANRGLVSNPGAAQGNEVSAIERISNTLGPQYATAIRDIQTGEAQNASNRYTAAQQLAATRQTGKEANANQIMTTSLQQLTGLSESQTTALLNSIGQGTTRQQVLGNLALQNLDQNRQWNQFLAQYGLDKQKLINDMNNGNTSQLMGLLGQFLQFTGMTTGGYIPPS